MALGKKKEGASQKQLRVKGEKKPAPPRDKKSGKGSKANPLDGVGGKLSADDIRQWITHPNDMAAKAKSTKKPPMPNKYGSLPAADLDALVAYMQSLK